MDKRALVWEVRKIVIGRRGIDLSTVKKFAGGVVNEAQK